MKRKIVYNKIKQPFFLNKIKIKLYTFTNNDDTIPRRLSSILHFYITFVTKHVPELSTYHQRCLTHDFFFKHLNQTRHLDFQRDFISLFHFLNKKKKKKCRKTRFNSIFDLTPYASP